MKLAAEVCQIVFNLAGAAAFVFIVWPAIREQRRLGRKLEGLIEGPRLQRVIQQVYLFLGMQEEAHERTESSPTEEPTRRYAESDGSDAWRFGGPDRGESGRGC